ncbi:protein Flattop isoform X2 [Vanacampus margaritifer]
MSSSFTANQYDDAFRPQRLQNWCQAKQTNKAPTTLTGRTTCIVDNRGHLLPGMRGSAWPDFKGTWDLPARIPAHRINPTSRSVEGLERLRAWGLDPEHTANSGPLGGSKNTDASRDTSKQNTVSTSRPPSSSAQASQSRPISADHTTGNQGRGTHADEVSSVTLPAADRQSDGRTVSSRLQSERATSALRPMTGEGEHSRPNTGSVSALCPQ